jgi:hypothetical protein
MATNQAANYAASEEALRRAGGRRINFRAQPKAARTLDAFVRKHKLEQTAAINLALENLKTLKEVK